MDPEGKNVFTSSMPVTADKTNSVNQCTQMDDTRSSMQKKQEEMSLQQSQVSTRSNKCLRYFIIYTQFLYNGCLNIVYERNKIINIFYSAEKWK